MKKEELFLSNMLPIWNQLDRSDQEILIQNVTRVVYHKGEHIHSQTKECLGVILIESGGLRTYILSEDGREITLYRLTKGDVCILSASCILNNITFDVHIDSEDESSVYIINAATFDQLSKRNIYVENYSYKIVSERFSDVMWAMEQILFMSFDKRLAIFLLDEITKTNSCVITMTHEQIAKYVGSAREVVSRMLRYFQNENIIEISRGSIKIIDKKKLKSLI